MLKYSNGLNYDITQVASPEHFYLSRNNSREQSDLNEHGRSRSPSARTFWKSPYAGNNSIFRNGSSLNRNIFLKPELTIKSSPYQTQTSPSKLNVAVKSILKNKDSGDIYHDTSAAPEDASPRGAYGKPNLITTGTDEAKPHGVKLETKSAGKRVQFNNLPKQNTQSKNNFLNMPIGKTTSSSGRRLYFNRTAAVRVLGSPNRCDKYGGSGRLNGIGSDKCLATTSLNSGESYIKWQINDFVRKLRLAENAKRVQSENVALKKNAVKRLTKPMTVLDGYDQWQEFDIERSLAHPKLPGYSNSRNNQINVPNESECNDHLTESSSVSLESLESPSGTNIAESTPGGAEVYRRKAPMAALFTKYRHITNNNPDLKRYDKKSVVTRTEPKTEHPTRKTMNFCDNDKTSQILGWLEDMKLAQSSIDDNKGSHRSKTPIGKDVLDPVNRVAEANSVTLSTKDEQSNSSQ